MSQGLPPPPSPPGVNLTFPGGVFTPDVTKEENDLFHAWHTFAMQAGPIAVGRLNRAVYFRRLLKKAVAL